VTFDFEVFPYADGGVKQIAAWLEDRCAKYDTPLEIEVVIRTKKAAGKTPVRLIEKALRECCAWGPAVWNEQDYRFDFVAMSFRRGERVLHVTPGEALFLYRALVQQKIDRSEVFCLKHLRRRFGNDFLRGYL
jgi:hypothetical protein